VNTRFAQIDGRPATALRRAIKSRNWYVLQARYARAAFNAELDAGLIVTNRRPMSFWVEQARRANRSVLFELTWARENGRAAA
jgi:hypothetical protein